MHQILKIFFGLSIVLSAHLAYSNQESTLSEECRVPEWARVIHIPQVHYAQTINFLSDEYAHFIKEVIAKNQVSIIKFIRQNKKGIFLSEGHLHSLDKRHRDLWLKSNDSVDLENLLGNFEAHQDYKKLNEQQQKLIIELGGFFTSFLLGDINYIHQSGIFENEAKAQERLYDYFRSVKQYNNSIDSSENITPSEIERLKQRKEELLFESQGFIFEEREQDLKNHVMGLFDPEESDQKIFFVYGMGHDFSNKFNESYFYQIPPSCVVPEKYTLTNKMHYMLKNVLKLLSLRAESLKADVDSFSYFKGGIQKRKKVVPAEVVVSLRKSCEDNYNDLANYVQREKASESKVFNRVRNIYYPTDKLKGILETIGVSCEIIQAHLIH